MTSELAPGDYIEEFVSLGAKTYSYRTSKGAYVIKVKGFTLTGKAEKQISLKSMLELLHQEKDRIVVEYPASLKRNKCFFTITQVDLEKKLSVTYDKRRIVDNEWNTVPFGFIDE